MLILEFMNATFQYYEKHRGITIYFESRTEVQVEKYTLLPSKQMRAQTFFLQPSINTLPTGI
jgi:hypothetical protein